MEVIREIRAIYDNYKSFKTEILASSMRTPIHVMQAAMAGADVATVPPAVPGARSPTRISTPFSPNWKKTGQAILQLRGKDS